ncbi:MAG: hypothetical protein J7L53_04075 [Deltaproteobacteria bacterium]|nr:hypothetical protein [Deltaproteobacteria bacterium]
MKTNKRKKSNKSWRANQVRVQFTRKPITAWGGIASLVSRFLEKVGFREWVRESIPIDLSATGRGEVQQWWRGI